jgi:EthD domain
LRATSASTSNVIWWRARHHSVSLAIMTVFAELWFDSVDEAAEAFSEPKYLEIIRSDELKFVDPHKCISFMTEELQVI